MNNSMKGLQLSAAMLDDETRVRLSRIIAPYRDRGLVLAEIDNGDDFEFALQYSAKDEILNELQLVNDPNFAVLTEVELIPSPDGGYEEGASNVIYPHQYATPSAVDNSNQHRSLPNTQLDLPENDYSFTQDDDNEIPEFDPSTVEDLINQVQAESGITSSQSDQFVTQENVGTAPEPISASDAIDELVPSAEDIFSKLEPSLQINLEDQSDMSMELLMMKSQLETSLSTMFSLWSSDLANIQQADVDNELNEFRNKIRSQPPAPIVDYMNAMENKRRVAESLQESIDSIRASYDIAMNAWLDQKLIELEREYRATHPDTTEEQVSELLATNGNRILEANEEVLRLSENAESELLLSFISTNSNPGLQSAFKFVMAKEKYQRSLDEAVELQHQINLKSQTYPNYSQPVYQPQYEPQPQVEPEYQEAPVQKPEFDPHVKLYDEPLPDTTDTSFNELNDVTEDDDLDALLDDIDALIDQAPDDEIDATEVDESLLDAHPEDGEIDSTEDVVDPDELAQLQALASQNLGDIDDMPELENDVDEDDEWLKQYVSDSAVDDVAQLDATGEMPNISQVGSELDELDDFDDFDDISENFEAEAFGESDLDALDELDDFDEDSFEEEPTKKKSRAKKDKSDASKPPKSKGKIALITAASAALIGAGGFAGYSFITKDKEDTPKTEQSQPADIATPDETKSSEKSEETKEDKGSKDDNEIKVGKTLNVTMGGKKTQLQVIEIKEDGSAITEDANGDKFKLSKEVIDDYYARENK